ncbi:hypothetical protein N473_05900 [Pseudoalteromonas luteoviolacea CPMOR-1]|uniref:Uncharacterized protein n=1 Tax=Pseudoalteromonas luteoviolacea CPMOR-1 TaxID=1365248 RepID=A0A167HLM1_9GAMM|nr:hypothetical protein [Pseudoalteromonas luteoviolacea]KZN58275.1 hypothetical protein N473_05900 [Pseudoalteromonas luteoviolacea CPMOR-1]
MFNFNIEHFDSSKNAGKTKTKSGNVITSLEILKVVSGGRGSGNYPKKRFSYTQRR